MKAEQAHTKLIARKAAIERLIKSDDGQELINYLADICLNNLGAPCKDALEYAYNEGKRSVFLAVMQMAEKDLGNFIYNIVREEETF